RSGASAATRVEYAGTRDVAVDGGGGGASDVVAIHGTGAGNAYTLSGTTPLGGSVTMDAWPRVAFDNLGTTGSDILLAGFGGDDTFTVGYIQGWQIASVTILGGASAAGDRVRFVGTTAQDVVSYTPIGADAATLSENASPTLVRASEIELVDIDGRRGNDAVSVYSGTGNNVITVTPGATGDAGYVQVDAQVPLNFSNLGAGGLLLLFDGSAADADTLLYNGTAATDAFTVANAVVYLNARIPVATANVTDYHLRGLGGDDSFTILSPLGIDILVEGDEPSGSDTLNFARDAAGAPEVLVRLDADKNGVPFVQTIQQVGYGVITHTGIEHVNVDVEDGALYVSGTRGDDVIEFTPLSPDSGVLTAAYIATTYLIDDVPPANPLVITGGGPGRGGPTSGGFADKVVYHGTDGSDLLRADTPNRTASLAILGFGYPAPVIESWRSIQLDDGTTTFGEPGIVEVLDVRARDGSDTIVVVPAENVGNGLYVNVDGGSPRASDALVISNLDAEGNPVALDATDFVVVGQSRVPDSGNILVFQGSVRRPSIAYDNVEVVSPLVPTGDNLLILGPDLYEQNEFPQTAAFLGAGGVLNVQNLAIFPNRFEHLGVPADQDYFRVVAAQTGILDFQVYFHMYDPAIFPAAGDLSIEVLDTSGAVIAGGGTFGSHDTTPNARVRIPAVAGQSYYLHVSGANGDVVNGYDLTVLNSAPPVPYDIELVDLPVDPDYDGTQDPPADNSDTGRSHLDNVTMDASPGILVRLDDGIFRHDLPGNPTNGSPPDEVIPIPFNASVNPASTAAGYRVAIYIEGAPQQPGVSPQTVIGYAQPGPVEGVYVFDFDDAIVPAAADLTDGSHFISARVEMIDPASTAQRGYGDRSAPLEIVVDTTPPEIEFLGLVDEDECPWVPENVTNDRTPSFYGFGEANAIIRFYLDSNNNGSLEPATDFLLGLTVAIPTDGNNQFPEGYFEFTSPVDLYDPMFGLPADVPRVVFATAEDLAGNVSPSAAAAEFAIFVDAVGPQITRVIVTGQPSYDLFDPKPSTDGPTPLVTSLTIDVRDLPNRLAPDFLYPALVESIAVHPGHYSLVGDANGIIAIQSITFVSAPIVSGQPARGSIILTFYEPLPDDRFTLTVSDALIDPACNHLDGESNTVEPQENPLFPTGDGVPGGDFVARFTVDSRPEIAVWGAGNVWVDTNGNFRFDPDNVDATNRDIIYQLGFTSDDVFAGNFAELAGGVADGFDKLAAYGRVGSSWRWLVDTDNNGVANIERVDPLNVNGLPFAGNFDGNAANGDEVGAFSGTTWYFDRNHDYRLDADTALVTTMRGYPMVGDFDGDGFDDLATYTDDRFQVDLANGAVRGWDGAPDHTFQFGYIGVRARPVAADMDMDGYDDFGLWLPDRTGQLPREIGEWNFLISGGASVLNRIEVDPITGQPRVRYTPVPFGNDIYAAFGDDYALPVVGNFDPPVTVGGGQPNTPPHTNPRQPLDVNDDGMISPIDALIPINYLNRNGGHKLLGAATSAPYLDVNGDGFISAIDALQVINHLNRSPAGGEGEGEGEADAASFAAGAGSLRGGDLLAATAPDQLSAVPESAWLLVPGAVADATTTTDTGHRAGQTPVVTSTVLSVGYLPFGQRAAGETLSALDDLVVAALDETQRTSSSLDEVLEELTATPQDDFVAAVDTFFRREE
ncbi:MAG: dockerin type I domain-containing protein, partial [Pirellulaceae bacterium]|nr:dockerin type I domain-containing protein [Pirellulaceae bacterium]